MTPSDALSAADLERLARAEAPDLAEAVLAFLDQPDRTSDAPLPQGALSFDALKQLLEQARASGEEAYVGVPHRRGVLVVHHAPRPGDGRPGTEVGSMRPLHSTALGKALAAFDPAARAEALAAGLTAVTPRTVTDAAAFDEELAGVRGRGWACDVGETWEGVASVAAPVFGHRRVLVGAVGVAGAVERVLTGAEPHPRLVASVRDCARSVSHELGAGRI